MFNIKMEKLKSINDLLGDKTCGILEVKNSELIRKFYNTEDSLTIFLRKTEDSEGNFHIEWTNLHEGEEHHFILSRRQFNFLAFIKDKKILYFNKGYESVLEEEILKLKSEGFLLYPTHTLSSKTLDVFKDKAFSYFIKNEKEIRENPIFLNSYNKYKMDSFQKKRAREYVSKHGHSFEHSIDANWLSLSNVFFVFFDETDIYEFVEVINNFDKFIDEFTLKVMSSTWLLESFGLYLAIFDLINELKKAS